MIIVYKRLLLVCCLSIMLCGEVYSESNIDFFFKNSSQYKDVIIKKILSTDTFVLEEKVGEKAEIIKLIGLRAPEAPESSKKDTERNQHGFVVKEEVSPLTPLEETAFEYVKELVVGQHVRLEFDADKVGNKQKTLAYVFLIEDGTFVNTEILRQGYANLQIRPPNTKYAKELREAYKEARAEKRGLQGQ